MSQLSLDLFPEHRSDKLVVFVGGHLTFSKHAIRLLEAEHPGIEFLRLSTLEELSETIDLRGVPRLTVIEDAIVEPMMSDPDAISRLVSRGHFTLAYRDPLTAQRLLAMTAHHGGLEEIGVWPLNAGFEVWLSVFNLLMCGEVLYPRAVIEPVPKTRHFDGAHLPSDRLTPREWEILGRIAEGQANKTIARALDLSEHTVKLHVHNLLRKLGVSNRTSAAGWYANHGAKK